MSQGHDAVNRADLVGIQDQLVVDANVAKLRFHHAAVHAAMRDERHATRQSTQHGGRTAEGRRFEGLTARSHQDDERARKISPEQDRDDAGDAGQQIRTELPADELERQR